MSDALRLHLRLLERRDLEALALQFRFSQHHPRNRWRERRLGLRTTLIGELEGRPVASVSFEERLEAPALLHLFALAVLPTLQRRGFGTAMIEAVEAEARVRGLEGVYLAVATDNEGAARLYERLGYRSLGAPYVSRWTWEGPEGEQREVVEECRRMLKRFEGQPARPPEGLMRPVFGP